jgi:hypothetical protein
MVVSTGLTTSEGVNPVLCRGYERYMSATSSKIKRWLLIGIGTASIIIGLIGIVMPILPTTPFLLLAAICYMRGSQRLYNALLCNRFLGNYIRNYLEGRGMSLKMKIWTLSFLWVAIICSAALATDSLILRIILLVVASGVTIHIAFLRAITKQKVVSG